MPWAPSRVDMCALQICIIIIIIIMIMMWCTDYSKTRPSILKHSTTYFCLRCFYSSQISGKKSNMTFCHHLFSCLWHNKIKAETFTVLMSEHNSWFLLSMDAFTVILPEGFKPFVLFLVYSGILCAINNFCIHILYACLYALFLCFPELHPTFLWFNSLISYWFNSDTIQFFIVLSH